MPLEFTKPQLEALGVTTRSLGLTAHHFVKANGHDGVYFQPRANAPLAPDVASFGNGTIVHVPTFPLPAVLKALGRSVVDYWSLDTEGGEDAILDATLDGDGGRVGIEVGLLTAEWYIPASPDHANQRRKAIARALLSRGWVRLHDGNKDDYYANPTYFTRRHLPLPPKGPGPVACTSPECWQRWQRAALAEAHGDSNAMRTWHVPGVRSSTHGS